jgi:hypothetical protein
MMNMSKIANDLRLMASGPRAGLAEISLPARQPGSSRIRISVLCGVNQMAGADKRQSADVSQVLHNLFYALNGFRSARGTCGNFTARPSAGIIHYAWESQPCNG